ncbi:MAG: DNA/RNA non-specific endonuclease [Tidjanibacter sp.]|nr:DNA/RNA non-specific endonuclease [Tidjanibacter sp.]
MKAVSAKVVAVIAMACAFISCTLPSSVKLPNDIYFNVGETVSHSTSYQFLSITSDEAWSIEVEYLLPEEHSDWCTLSATSGEGSANVVMNFGKNELEVERSLKLIVTFQSEVQELTMTQHSANSPKEEENLSGWLELPTFETDDKRFYFSKHLMPSKNKRERSFSLFYDAQNYIPLWVAYPLCKDNIGGSGNRVDDWGIYDPNIPQSKQLYMRSSYAGSYDRGHMLPSASRLGSNEDNRQTFYPTNMTPQLSGLNQKKWASIEGQVRNWAESCDTLYVVTGAVLQTVGGGENISYTYCRSDNDKDVAIPNYYYKALLQYRKSTNTYQALAIWVRHIPDTGNATMDDVITIDELENRLGIDFFHNLNDATEQKVEATVDARYWGFQEQTIAIDEQ